MELIFVTVTTVAAIATGLLLLRKYNERSWGKCNTLVDMTGKTVIITGASNGLGKATAKELAKLNANIVLACRDSVKGHKAIDEIRKDTQNGNLKVLILDLSSLRSIKAFAEEFLNTESRLDVLINNAGVYRNPDLKTKDGFEAHFGINHLGHFYLTQLLLNVLKKSSPSRIVIVSSSLYKKGKINISTINDVNANNYREAYCNSKLANILFCRELSRQLKNTKVNVFAVSPGFCFTNLGHNAKPVWWKMILSAPFAILFIRSAYQGCQTILHCAISPNLCDDDSGSYFRNCKKEDFIEVNEETASFLWHYSESCIQQCLLKMD